MKLNKKIIVGSILLLIWAIFFIVLLFFGRGSEEFYLNIFMVYFVCIFAIPGCLVLYYGLSYPERGIMLIITGFLLSLPLIIFTISLLIDPILVWTDLVITIYIMLMILWVLLLLIPGIYIIYATNPKKDRKYSKNILRYHFVTVSLTFIGITLFNLIAYQMSLAYDPGVTFRDTFFANFWIAIPIGFLLGIGLLALGWILYELRVWR